MTKYRAEDYIGKTFNRLTIPQYGGRGIKVCDRWRTSFENFLEDMGSKPERQSIDRGLYTIGRIDNDGDYTPDNCRWESPKQQSNNRSSCKAITINGETLNRTQWIEKLGLNYASVISRLRMGWTEIDALTTPFQKKKPKAHTNNEDEQLPPQCNCRELDYEKLE